MPFDENYKNEMRFKLNRFAENPKIRKIEKLKRIQFYRVNWESQAVNMHYLISHKLMVVKKVGDSYNALFHAWQLLSNLHIEEKSDYFLKCRLKNLVLKFKV